jgi:hypothetical protein
MTQRLKNKSGLETPPVQAIRTELSPESSVFSSKNMKSGDKCGFIDKNKENSAKTHV